MTNFAERLVARNAGISPGPGYSVLTPRPASRFEPVTSLDNETRAGPASEDISVTTRPAPQLETATKIGSTISHYPAEADARRLADQREAALPTPPDVTIRRPGYAESIVHVAMREDIAPIPPSYARETVPQPIPTKPDASDDLARAIDAAKPREPADAPWPEIPRRPNYSELMISSPLQPERDEHLPLSPTSSQSRPSPAIRAAESERPQAPAISIGKIEVQFLPQEPRLAPMPQPQRTRGFEAYARARRGEPR